MQRALPATGVTSFVATTMTMEQGVIETALKRIKAAKENYTGGAHVLGAHLEGPFISPLYKGSQSEDAYRIRISLGWNPMATSLKSLPWLRNS